MADQLSIHKSFNPLPLLELPQYCCLVSFKSAHRIYQGHCCVKLKWKWWGPAKQTVQENLSHNQTISAKNFASMNLVQKCAGHLFCVTVQTSLGRLLMSFKCQQSIWTYSYSCQEVCMDLHAIWRQILTLDGFILLFKILNNWCCLYLLNEKPQRAKIDMKKMPLNLVYRQ